MAEPRGSAQWAGRWVWTPLMLLPVFMALVYVLQQQGGTGEAAAELLQRHRADLKQEWRGLNHTLQAVQAQVERLKEDGVAAGKKLDEILEAIQGLQGMAEAARQHGQTEDGIEAMQHELESLRSELVATVALSQVQPDASKWELAQTKSGSSSYQFVNYVGQSSQLSTRMCKQVPELRPDTRQGRSKKVVAVIPYFNEEDLLYARFLEHYDVLDYFIVIESPLTHSGNPKPLNFDREVCRRFAEFTPKVVHVIENNTAELERMGIVERENEPRVLFGVVATLLRLQHDDLILSSDLDEIPTASAVRTSANMVWNAMQLAQSSKPSMSPIVFLELDLYFYSFYHFVKLHEDAAKIYAYEIVDRYKCSVQDLRQGVRLQEDKSLCPQAQVLTVVKGAGIHASCFLSPEDLALKLKSYSHSDDFGKPEIANAEALKKRIRENKDYADRPLNLQLRNPMNDKILLTFTPEARKALHDLSEKVHTLQELE